MPTIGIMQTLRMTRTSDFGAYLGDGSGDDVLLPRKYVPDWLKPGGEIEVFVYTDSSDRPVATTRRPAGCLGDVVKLRAASVGPIGAFLDWGLEKDILVPFREMKNKSMKTGQEYVVKILFDPLTGRLFASNRFERITRGNNPAELKPNRRVELIVLEPTRIGYSVLIDEKFVGMLYRNEVFEPIAPGDRKTGYILNVRADGLIDVRLRPVGRSAVAEAQTLVLTALQEHGGELPLDSRSSAVDVEALLPLSRKLFKEAIGALYRERKIEFSDGKTRLVTAPEA